MIQPWHIHVYEKHQPVYAGEFGGLVELGRQGDTTEEPYSHRPLTSGGRRLVIARFLDQDVSRRHAMLEPLTRDRLRLRNLSEELGIGLPDGRELQPRAACDLNLPAWLTFGGKQVRIEGSWLEPEPLHSLAEATPAPGSSPNFDLATLETFAGDGRALEALLGWLQSTMDLLQSTADAGGLFAKAAQAVVNLVGLDTGRVLLLEKDEWRMEARWTRSSSCGGPDCHTSHSVLNQARQEKRTFWQMPITGADANGSAHAPAVVVAPILDRQGKVLGVLYGDRRRNGQVALSPITKAEAMLVELLASGLASGLARVQREKAAAAARVQLEKFLTPELTHPSATRPETLQGRDCEVSLLFCDIRRFSAISERLGPTATGEWIGEILETLSECILAHQGVLVDYRGDEVMAMWGASEEQTDHAILACRAALAMLERVPQLNARWQSRMGAPLELGLGVNTGRARVGNAGTPRQFKFGPVGNTVNLASRVQGATKYLKCRLLVTQATQAQLNAGFDTRRLCTARVVNIAEPVALYEVAAPGQPDWPEVKERYERALADFERQQFHQAAQTLAGLVAVSANDGPTLVLMSRTMNALVEGPSASHPVWELPGK